MNTPLCGGPKRESRPLWTQSSSSAGFVPSMFRNCSISPNGGGLSSETYMEWILLKAGRLFLILDAIAIPDRIFALVDESRDDDDLPFAEPHIDMLNLSPNGNDAALDSRFFQTQWRFLVRGITEGEHVTYTGNEGVPVEIVRSITNGGVQGRDDTVDKVILAGSVSRMFMRTQVQVGGAPHFFSSEEVLAEVKKLRRLAHRHLVSLYASYFVDDTICALFTGAETDRSLHSFVTDEPPSFKRLAKEERRQTLITWPHCLVSALSWLHSRGYAHAAIRPSNILIDPEFNIYLGQFQALDSLLAPPKLNDLESYNYSAPERWVRIAAPVQPAAAPSRTMLPSGGRTARRRKPEKGLSPLSENSPTSPDFSRPESAASSASKGTVIRIGLPGSPSRFSFAFSSSSSSTASSGQSEVDSAKQQRLSIWKKPRKMLSTPSLSSAYSSSSGSSASSMTPPRLVIFKPNSPQYLEVSPIRQLHALGSLLPCSHHPRHPNTHVQTLPIILHLAPIRPKPVCRTRRRNGRCLIPSLAEFSTSAIMDCAPGRRRTETMSSRSRQ
ncbi:hypothetical protein N7526_002543 [Penicillium atrosanguineum]|nr:hypothetical protein N7526_002543 [Penicillium atrosanguineum]